MTSKILTFAAALALALNVSSAERIVDATGVGDTYRAAVNAALLSALEQAYGVTASSEESAKFVERATSATTVQGTDSRRNLDDAVNRAFKKAANGKIEGYEVVSEGTDPATGKCRVSLKVRFPGGYDLGLDPDNRRRMVVANFRSATGDTFSWCGQNESTATWAATLADKLNERLTQTRKFTMIDRKFDAEAQDELARLSDKNAARGETVRLGQRLGTDYLLVGDVRFANVAAPGRNPVTGQFLPSVSQRFAEVSYRVILAPTGQIKWADTVAMESGEFPAADVQAFLAASAEGAAQRIIEGMMANIFPYEIVGRNGAGEIIIGEGGLSLAEGEMLTVYALGEKVRDSRTGEVLDQVEEPVGSVQIVRVMPKLSYARITGGDAAKMVAGSRVRRPQSVQSPVQAATPAEVPATSVRGTGNGGVVTPF